MLPYKIERRRHPRVERNVVATILIVGVGFRNASTYPCRVIDTSVGGALIDPLGANVPDYFYLEISGEKERASCAVVRRSGTTVGVKFY
jgi:hypothetical protein